VRSPGFADLREKMLRDVIAVLLQYGDYVQTFEQNPEARESLLLLLMSAYDDSRMSITISGALNGMWKVRPAQP